MMYWPVINSNKDNLKNKEDNFWKNRGDRYHCGLDIYSNKGNKVLSITKGKVYKTGTFTSPKINNYWNKTYYILIKFNKNKYLKYAELEDFYIQKGDMVKPGSIIGKIGQVLKPEKIEGSSPKYIHKLKKRRNLSMLHLELYEKNPITNHKFYSGGNWFGENKPKCLKNPDLILKNSVIKE
ncbi:MAG: M23 family metallopeptidase [Candidatus Thermoplasmatota archaeon]